MLQLLQFVHAYVSFSVLWAQLPELNNMMIIMLCYVVVCALTPLILNKYYFVLYCYKTMQTNFFHATKLLIP